MVNKRILQKILTKIEFTQVSKLELNGRLQSFKIAKTGGLRNQMA